MDAAPEAPKAVDVSNVDRDADAIRAVLKDRDAFCPACGHNVSGTTDARCTECGELLVVHVYVGRLGVEIESAGRGWLPLLGILALGAAIHNGALGAVFVYRTIADLLHDLATLSMAATNLDLVVASTWFVVWAVAGLASALLALDARRLRGGAVPAGREVLVGSCVLSIASVIIFPAIASIITWGV